MRLGVAPWWAWPPGGRVRSQRSSQPEEMQQIKWDERGFQAVIPGIRRGRDSHCNS